MYRVRPIYSSVLALLFISVAGLPGFRPLPETASALVPLRLFAMAELKAGHNGHYLTKADINNRSVNVLVDTGASAVALSFEDAEQVGLHPGTLKYDVPVSTANGVGKAARVVLREVEIDTVRVNNVEGLVLAKGAMQGTLLGMSFLGRLRSFGVEDGTLRLKN